MHDSDIATCSRCHSPTQQACAACPFNCDLHPHCQDQGCESDPQKCKRVNDRELAIMNGTATCAADWIAQQEAKNEPPASARTAWHALCEMERRLFTPEAELSYTQMICPGCGHRGPSDCSCVPHPHYGVKFIHEGNPGGDPYNWVAEMFMRQQKEKPMSAQDFALRWLGQVLTPIYLYIVGMIAAFFIAMSSASAYTPMTCYFDYWGRPMCTYVATNPGAKIINIDPPIEREPARLAPAPAARPPVARVEPPVEIAPVPLPRPRPLNLGGNEPDRFVAPIDRPRQVIQQ